MTVYSFQPERHAEFVPQPTELPGMRQLSHVQEGHNHLAGESLAAYPYDLEQYLIPGFHALDGAMLNYFTGLRVPTKDSYRFLRVKLAGGDKSLQIWNDDLHGGRVRMPVAAISREQHQFNAEKFSPAYHAMTVRYLSSRGDMAAKVFRPVPVLVDYTLSVWAERKRDAEHIAYQIQIRFNPLAEFRMSDGRLTGNVQLRYGGLTDASDKETGFDQNANVRYEVSMTAEAWLPLPEKLVPTILGRVRVLSEQSGTVLGAALGSAMTNALR